jgi:predicted RNA-binding Zn ribbon-like protein
VHFDFLADRPVLNFVATVAERGSTDLEQLQVCEDLVRWVTQSGLTSDPLRVTAAQLERARGLREAMFALITALINRTPPRPAGRELVNAAAARPRPHLRLTTAGAVHRTGDLDAVLALLAEDCLALFDGPDRDNLSRCADPRCTRPFIDRSRGRRRRWCGMKGCGDRAKAAAYRQRQRTSDA